MNPEFNNLILNKLGIIVWKLKYPIILQSNKPIQLLTNLRLLIISNLPISLNDLFIKDVMRSMNIDYEEVYVLVSKQVENLILPPNFLNYCWWIGVKILYNFHCINLYTPSLEKLKYDIDSKRDLWNQINHSMYHYYD